MNSKISKRLGFLTAFMLAATAAFSIGNSPAASVYAENLTAAETLSTETMPLYEATEAPADSFKYTVNGSNATITGYSGTVADLKIPSTIDGYDVTAIGDRAFQKNTVITSVEIPDSVTTLGYYAFYNCSKLTSVSIPESVVSMDNYVFRECHAIKSIEIKNSFIGYGMFENCDGIESVIIPENVTSIGYRAFYDCDGITSVKVTKNVVTIGESAFAICENIKDITLENSIIGTYMFAVCPSLETVTIPENIINVGVYSFNGCDSLKTINLYNSTISDYMFAYCDGLETVVIPDNISSVGNYAFKECKGLKSVTIKEGVVKLGTNIFYNCDALKNVKLENMLIPNYTFYDCDGLETVTIPGNILSVGTYAFYDCDAITTLNVENGVGEIGEKAFYSNDKLKNISLPDTLRTIGYMAFSSNIAIESVTVPKNVTSLGGNIFSACPSLKSFTLKNSVISAEMFYNCDGLSSVTIPANITSVGRGCFAECDNISAINFENTTISSYMFDNCNALKTLVIPDTVTSIGQAAFRDCISLTTITVPSSVTSIGVYAFRNCDALTNVTIGSKVIGSSMFYDCDKLKDITVSGTVSTIDEGAFTNCDILSTVILEEGVTSIRDNAFDNCTYLKKIVIPSSVTVIRYNPFPDSTYLSVYGYAGTYAETFAEKYGFPFVELAPIEITEQPVDFTGGAGSTATFKVAATGENLTYQWQQNVGNGWDDISIAAGRNATFNIVITPDRNGYQYRCVISDGTNTIISDVAEIIYKSALAIKTQPVDYTGKVGTTAKFTIVATDATSYQWQQNTGSGWVNINTTAGRSASFSIAVTAARNGYQYRCIVSDGTNTLTSDAAKIIVQEDLAIKTQPVDYVGKVGDTAKFTLTATAAKSYQWYQNTGSGWVAMNTAAGKSNTISVSVAAFRVGFQYKCVVSDGTNTLTSDVVSIKLAEVLAIKTQPVDYVGEIGDTAKFTIEATAATSYQWYQNTGSGWVAMNTAAGRSKSISIAVAQFRVGFQYKCVVSDGTNTLTSNIVSIKLDEVLAITEQPVDYVGEIGDTAKFTITATGVKYYQWQQNTGSGWVNINTAAGRSNSISIAVAEFRVGYQYRCMISDGTTLIASDVVAIMLNEVLAITGQPEDYVGTIGGNAVFTIKASGVKYYQWQQNTGSGWVNIDTAAGRSNTITIPVAAFRVGYQYRCMVSDGTNLIASDVATLLI